VNKSRIIGIVIGASLLGVVGIYAVTYQSNFENLNGLPQTDSKVGLTDEIAVSVEKKSEDQSQANLDFGLTDEIAVSVEKKSEEQNQTTVNKSYNFLINETFAIGNP